MEAEERWFYVWLSIFTIVLGTAPFAYWQGYHLSGIIFAIVGLGGLLMFIRDRLATTASKWPIRVSLKVLAVVALSLLVGQLIGREITGFRVSQGISSVQYGLCGVALLLVAAVVSATLSKSKPSKLIIHRAIYAVGLPTEVDVTDKFQSMVRDGISITVDGTLGNLVPDPAFGIPKRLDVEYSYGTDTRILVSRTERPIPEIMRLVLPEDTEVKRLESELQKVQASQPKPVQYPIPQLRLKVIAVVSDLQGFLGVHGQEPEVTQRPNEPGPEYLTRVVRETGPWRAKFYGDFCGKFRDRLPILLNEIRVRTGLPQDSFLDSAIEQANKNINANVATVERIVKLLWELALQINT